MTGINHVTDTALWVAHYRAEESRRPDALFQDPLAELLAGERGRQIAKSMPYGGMLAWIMAVRTVAIDSLIERALAAGVDAVVNLGAGLDTRPYRMNLPATLHWIEVDFPEMIAYKSERLRAETPRCQLERVKLDLSRREDARKFYADLGARFKKILVITEGVVIYLAPEEVRNLAQDLASVPGIHFWIQDYRNNAPGGWRIPKGYQRRMKSAPFRFMPPDTKMFFAPLGWTEEVEILTGNEARRLKRPVPLGFPFNFLMRLMPAKKRASFNSSSGYILFKRG